MFLLVFFGRLGFPEALFFKRNSFLFGGVLDGAELIGFQASSLNFLYQSSEKDDYFFLYFFLVTVFFVPFFSVWRIFFVIVVMQVLGAACYIMRGGNDKFNMSFERDRIKGALLDVCAMRAVL
jgi:hypothetical protein